MGLFRAKRLTDNKWIEGFYVCIANKFHYIFTGKFHIKDGFVGMERYEIDPQTLNQFTKLYDSSSWNDITQDEQSSFLNERDENGEFLHSPDWKGRKIFQGDIVYSKINDDYAVVTYINGGFKLNFSYYSYIDWYQMIDQLIVVGNIYDNSELLRKINDNSEETYNGTQDI